MFSVQVACRFCTEVDRDSKWFGNPALFLEKFGNRGYTECLAERVMRQIGELEPAALMGFEGGHQQGPKL